ncbi:MAG TPA: SUF system NifU family Fe-S cluster assembly protein [Chloroflexota bacterium]|nr:SUF system NifU family Fe-S cluster assembly protein [Chloroflexota bacterium]
MDIYREVILDHYQNPRHHGELADADVSYEDNNPLCGDRIRMQLKVDKDDRIVDVAFDGQGCAISQASASMLTEEILGKKLPDVLALGRQDVLDNLGIELTPIRLKCALLSLGVLKAGIYQYKGQKPVDEDEEL